MCRRYVPFAWSQLRILLHVLPPKSEPATSATCASTADISIKTSFKLYWDRSQGAKIRIPKAMDTAFAQPETEEERQIKALIRSLPLS
jgi:hypothetical protein